MNEFLQRCFSALQRYFANKDVFWYLSLVPFASLLVVLVQCHRRFSTKRVNPPTLALDNPDIRISPESLTKFHGGPTIFAFLAGRVVACIMLFLVSLCLEFPRYDPGLLKRGFDYRIPVYYLYCAFLSLATIFRTTYHNIFSQHCFMLLFVSLLVDCKRNIWPLATYFESPADADDGPLVWVRVALLFASAIMIPLFCPRKYTPVNLMDQAEEANPEQTTSLISLMVYSFLDPLLFLAARVPHLSYDQLFPLADYDYSRNTTKRAFPHLDMFQGAKKRHIFFGLMRTYRYEYAVLATTIVIQVMANLASPIGIQNILYYLESGRRDVTVKPWFWILWLFIGPMTISLARQWYIFVATRMLVHTEGLLTQLIFEHSLRVRMKAETSKQPDGASTTNNANDHRARADNLIGKINNLVTTDTMNIVEARDFLMIVFFHPLQIVVSIVFLYQVLGVSAFVGLAVIVAMVPIPAFLATLIQKVQVERMKTTDARIQVISETCNVLRMVKMFGWEDEMQRRVAHCRADEVKWLWLRRVYGFIINLLNFSIPALTMIATYGAYTIILKQELSAAKVFSSMAVFNLLQVSLQNAFQNLSVFIEGKVSLDRMTDFLQNTELLDFIQTSSEEVVNDVENKPPPGIVGFCDASFVWSKEGANDSRAFMLRIDGELRFKQGGINLVIGPTGSGKTSLLMALLGEMHFLPIQPHSWFGLPREKGIAYVAQESWVQNDTIRGNILFGAPYDEERYKAVLYQCGLERDLNLFEAGDLTEVGEKGLTLSGGQKARVTLARAVYSNAQLLLLDDILAALDVHTSKWIVEHCLNGHLVKGRTVILVTHNVALTSDSADFVVSIGSNGTVVSQGTDITTALSRYSNLASGKKAEDGPSETKATKEGEEQATSSASTPEGKLIVSEEVQQGHVTWKAMKLFLASAGGKHPIAFFLVFFFALLVTHLALMSQTYVLGYWGSQYTERDPSDINPFFYLGLYGLVLLTVLSCYAFANLLYLHGVYRGCIIIHERLVDSILGATFRWLDETPTSRIITRCTQDIRAVDVPITQWVGLLAEFTIAMITRLVAIVIFSHVFLIPAIFVAVMGAWLANFYLKAQLSVKREMSNAKAPLLAHLEAAITGLTSIRAYGAQDAFKQESLKRIDFYSRISRVSYNLNRWVAIRMDVLGATFTTALATYLVYGSTTNPVGVGFSLNMAITFCSTILWWVRIFNDLEVQANSLERIQGYLEIEQEKKPTGSGVPPAAWPTSGHLLVKNLSARYSKHGPNVLHDISFEVGPGERIGVVGRTGSGKSSLMLSLLRCIVVDGDVYYDGLDTKNINLDALRSKLTIIPQMPELLSGTLRRNLDPFEQYDDATLNAALRASGLFSLQTEEGEKRLTLDSQISSGGSNLSVGQRQILALARAMVRESKLLILDEATSAIDYKTDSIIQQSLRCELGKDVTVITVAHRLQTIMDADKILVLDAGKIVEYDSPAVLLTKSSGQFKSMVDGSGDREYLYSIVHRATS